jgi:lysophospholipase L1-like esterase
VTSELGSIKAGDPPPTLPAADVLRASQAAALQAAVISYNQVIASEAQQNGAVLVDLYSLVNSLRAGMPIDGATLTLGYLGGFYGIDGIHLTNTGYALVANQFIAAMNTGLGLSIPAADIPAVAAKDPLFPSNL